MVHNREDGLTSAIQVGAPEIPLTTVLTIIHKAQRDRADEQRRLLCRWQSDILCTPNALLRRSNGAIL
jgi:hypothetical protein